MRDFVSYSPYDGLILWLVGRGNSIKPGAIAGRTRQDGYVEVKILGRAYKAHNLAWELMTGERPPKGFVVDHINRNRSDNRWSNLRLASLSENGANAKLRRAKNLAKGVSAQVKRGRIVGYRATAAGKYLGLFADEASAHEAYLQAAKSIYGEFASAG